MPINNVNSTTPKVNAGRPVAAPKVANAPAAQAPKFAGDVFKAQDPASDEKALNEFIAANKDKYPEIETAKLNLSEHLAAGAVLFVLSGAVGFGAHEVIRRLSDRKHAFVEAKAMSTDPLERKLVAQKGQVSLGTQMRLAADPDLSVRYALAARVKSKASEFDAAVLEILANDPSPMIRGMVASSEKLSAKTVAKLANSDTETSPQVRAAALGNKKLDKEQRKWLEELDAAKGGIYATLVRIMSAPDTEANAKQKLGFLRSNPNIGLTREMMEALAKSENAGVREALGRRPDAPDDLIKQMYEHRSYTFFQKIKKFFGMEPGLPGGKAQYEQDRVVLMTLANNPNASVSMLTHMVESVKKDASKNGSFRSSIDPKVDVRLGIPTTDQDPSAYNIDIVLRAIVGNPRTDDTMRTLANAAMTPYRIDEKKSLEAFLSLNAANGLYLNGKYAEAADAYKKAIAGTFHDSEQAYFELGQCLMAMNQVEQARQAFIQALNINNNYTAAAEMLDAINRPNGGR